MKKNNIGAGIYMFKNKINNKCYIGQYKEDAATFLKCTVDSVRAEINGNTKTCKGYSLKQIT